MIVQFAATRGDFVGRTAIAAKQFGHQGCKAGIDWRKTVVHVVSFFRADMGLGQPMQRHFLCSGVRRTNNAKRVHTHAVCAEKPITNNTGLNQRSHKGARLDAAYKAKVGRRCTLSEFNTNQTE